jgi:hypothetical protein
VRTVRPELENRLAVKAATMAPVSHNTAELGSVAGSFQRSGIGGAARLDFETAGLPEDYWPTMVMANPAGEYGDLADEGLRCARLLQESVVAVGNALEQIARHYRQMEDRHGKAFDALGAKLPGGG